MECPYCNTAIVQVPRDCSNDTTTEYFCSECRVWIKRMPAENASGTDSWLIHKVEGSNDATAS